MKNRLRTLKCLEMFFKSARTNIEWFQNVQLEKKHSLTVLESFLVQMKNILRKLLSEQMFLNCS